MLAGTAHRKSRSVQEVIPGSDFLPFERKPKSARGDFTPDSATILHLQPLDFRIGEAVLDAEQLLPLPDKLHLQRYWLHGPPLAQHDESPKTDAARALSIPAAVSPQSDIFFRLSLGFQPCAAGPKAIRGQRK